MIARDKDRSAMRARWIAVGSLALALAGALSLSPCVTGDHEPAKLVPSVATRPADDTSNLRAVQQQVMSLRSELARLDDRVAAQLAASPAAPPADPAAGRASPAERQKAALEQQHRAVAFLDERIASEPHDPAWTSEVRAGLASSLEAGAGSVRSVECGATLCRADTSHADRQTFQHFVDNLSGTLHRSFQLFFERDGDMLAATVFIAREGQPMPDLAKGLRADRDSRPAAN
jgi:hypothetical protein